MHYEIDADAREPRASSLAESMDHAFGTIAAASSTLLETIHRFDVDRLWARDGATSMSAWLAARYGVGWGTAREWVESPMR